MIRSRLIVLDNNIVGKSKFIPYMTGILLLIILVVTLFIVINLSHSAQKINDTWRNISEPLKNELLISPILTSDAGSIVGLYQSSKPWSWSPFGVNKGSIKAAQIKDGIITAKSFSLNERIAADFDMVLHISANQPKTESSSQYVWQSIKFVDSGKIQKIARLIIFYSYPHQSSYRE